jgi:hypothetical protein
MALKTRLKRLEDAAVKTDYEHKVAMITYEQSEKSEAEAVAEWEVENGPIEGYQIVFMTSYEPERP